MNESSITPSIPRNRPAPSRYPAKSENNVLSPISMLFVSQMSAPHGAAAVTARPITFITRSSTERTITSPTFGILYGGSSSVYDEASPRNRVSDSTFERISDAATPMRSTAKMHSPALTEEEYIIPTQAMIIGSRPLHGVSEFVIIAIRLSRGESIILHPTTPTELQPSPISIVSDCFPHTPHFSKVLSSTNAARGRYPMSSSRVNSGKNITIGGSMTEIPLNTVPITPLITNDCMRAGIFTRSPR